MARVIFRQTFQCSMVDYCAKLWMIPINDKKNMIRLIKIVNNPCIGKNLCKAIINHLSFNIQDITRESYAYKRNMAPSPSNELRRSWTWTNPQTLGKERQSQPCAFDEERKKNLSAVYESLQKKKRTSPKLISNHNISCCRST